MTTKIQNQIEERIDEKICVSEMIIEIDRFIKELNSFILRSNELKIVLNSLKGRDTVSRI